MVGVRDGANTTPPIARHEQPQGGDAPLSSSGARWRGESWEQGTSGRYKPSPARGCSARVPDSVAEWRPLPKEVYCSAKNSSTAALNASGFARFMGWADFGIVTCACCFRHGASASIMTPWGRGLLSPATSRTGMVI